jgi:hypothetical protein
MSPPQQDHGYQTYSTGRVLHISRSSIIVNGQCETSFTSAKENQLGHFFAGAAATRPNIRRWR